MTMRVWLLVALLMGMSAPAGWAVCADGMIMPLPPAEGEQAPPEAEAEDGGKANGEEGAEGSLVLVPGGCYTPEQLATLKGAVPATLAVDPEGTAMAAEAMHETQLAQGGGSGGGEDGGGVPSAVTAGATAKGGDVLAGGEWGGGENYIGPGTGSGGFQQMTEHPDVIETRYEPVVAGGQTEPVIQVAGTGGQEAIDENASGGRSDVEAGGGRFRIVPVPDENGRILTDGEMQAQVAARNARDEADGVVRVANRITLPEETTQWTGGLARDQVLGTLGNAAARAQDPSTNIGAVCAREGLACADPQTLRLAGIKSGLESGFGAAQSSVTASGRVDQGTYNHYSPERIDYLNARYNTGWTREEVYGSLDRQAELALIDTAHNLRLADSRMTNAGLTYAEAGITREQFAYCINTRGEAGCTVTNVIKDFGNTDPNVARANGVAYVPNFQKNAERHSETVTDYFQRAGTFTGQLSGVTMAGMGLTGARTGSVAAVGNVLGTGQALLSPAQQVAAMMQARDRENQMMRDMMAMQQMQQLSGRFGQMGNAVRNAGTSAPNTLMESVPAQTFQAQVFNPGTVGTTGGAGVTPANAKTPAVQIVPVASPNI